MNDTDQQGNDLGQGLSPASEGAGALLQRDYWGVVDRCRLTCPQVAEVVRECFWEFPPPSLVVFTPLGDGPLEVGDELEVRIRMAPTTGVRVLHLDSNSITLATMSGHPEAGRITFAAYRNGRADVIFHIRSLARASSVLQQAGFIALGDAMQTATWTDFIDALAHRIGKGVIGAIYVTTQTIEDEEDSSGPTFLARGD